MDKHQITAAEQAGMPSRAMLVAAAIGFITLVAIITYAVLYSTTIDETATNYDECVKAGGTVSESQPEQCVIDGKSHLSGQTTVAANSDDYVGLTEQAAIDKAQRARVPHRVVERDGQPLPVNMDLVQGRYNFHVKDGKVYSVFVEKM